MNNSEQFVPLSFTSQSGEVRTSSCGLLAFWAVACVCAVFLLVMWPVACGRGTYGPRWGNLVTREGGRKAVGRGEG